MAIDVKQLRLLPSYLWGSLHYHLSGTLFTAKPRMVQFPVCDRCNARCIMCNRWSKESKEEITIEKIQEVFRSPLFSKVEQINLHGGEPTLRRDLPEICRIVLDSCPKLSHIWISTNGIGTKRIESRVREIAELPDLKRIASIGINVSIDGIGKTHDRIRGVEGGFDQAVNTLQAIKRLAAVHPIQLTIGTVIQPSNLRELDAIVHLGASLGVPVLFQPLMFDEFFNLQSGEKLRFSEDDARLLQSIIRTKLSRGSSLASFYWCDYLAMAAGRHRQSPCAFDRYILSLYPTGEIMPCSARDWILFGNVYDEALDSIWYGPRADAIRKRMRREVCPTCSAYCAVEFSLQKEFLKYFAFYVRRILSGKEKKKEF
jgi:MoaA/NifB/PqqE/SkfB family radical SAM enzyme